MIKGSTVRVTEAFASTEGRTFLPGMVATIKNLRAVYANDGDYKTLRKNINGLQPGPFAVISVEDVGTTICPVAFLSEV